MKIARKPRPSGDIDVTSFSDIAFLLIIFFVLTTTFTRMMGMTVSIPASTSDPARKSEEQYPTVVLTQESMQFQDANVTVEKLRNRLRELKLAEKKEEERFIVLESSPDVEYSRYFQVVTAIANAGGILALAEPIEEAETDGAKTAGGEGGAARGVTNTPPTGGAAP